MISRAAESCFWLLRYMERTENTARLLEVNRSSVSELSDGVVCPWRPMVIVAGEEERFTELHGAEAMSDGDKVEDYLVWNQECPVSVWSSIKWGRENARTIRETISLEMWEAINELWLWIESRSTRSLYRRERDDFYRGIKKSCYYFHGVGANTVSHGEPFDFMRLGMLLERAGQTARILDVHHHALRDGGKGEPKTMARWLAILNSCSAYEALFKKSRKPLSGRAVAEFLLLDDAFPRSYYYCLLRALNFFKRIRPGSDSAIGRRSSELFEVLINHVSRLGIDRVFEIGLHEEVTYLVDKTTELCDSIHRDYFDLSSETLFELVSSAESGPS